MVHLRDDRKLVGVLRSYDQYGAFHRPISLDWPAWKGRSLAQADHTVSLRAPPHLRLAHAYEPLPFPPHLPSRNAIAANLVLTQTIERLFHPPSKSYAQTDRGVFLVRGENVVLLGEVVRPVSHSSRRCLAAAGGARVHDVADCSLTRLACAQDLDTEDAPLSRLTLLPWSSLSALLASEKKHKHLEKQKREGVLFAKCGFGEEGGEGDAY